MQQFLLTHNSSSVPFVSRISQDRKHQLEIPSKLFGSTILCPVEEILTGLLYTKNIRKSLFRKTTKKNTENILGF